MTGAKRVGVEFNPHIAGGTEHFLRALFSRLDHARVEPVAIASCAGAWQAFLDGIAETHIVPYVTAAGEPADVAGALRRLDLDVVQSSYFSPVVALAATHAGIPHVWRMGGHVDALEREWTARQQTHLLTIVRFTSRRVVCGSRYLRSQFGEVGLECVEVIHNGIDLTALPASGRREERADLRVAMVAHLVPQKRHGVFLRAVARVATQVPRARFSIFGGGYGTAGLSAYEQSLHTLARELAVDRVLEIHELRSQRFDTLRHVDIVALPGVNEGASNAILEAMALGIPVVAARSGGNAELVEDGVTGVLVPADNVEALAVALVALLRDPARRCAMGVAARARVEREFDITVCAHRYQELYADVVRPTPRAVVPDPQRPRER